MVTGDVEEAPAMTERATSLVYHAGALGDFITTIPAFHAWRRARPGDRIVLLGSPALATLALPGLFDDAWDARSRRFAPLFSAEGPGPRGIDGLQWVRSALLFASSSSPIGHHLFAMGVSPIVRQDPFPSDPVPIVDYHLSLFAGVEIPAAERIPRVRVDRARPPRDIVALHAGSGGKAKRWPRERFMELADVLRHEGHAVAWIQGPAEEGEPAPAGAEVWRNLDLADLAAALAGCRLYVGNDCGVTHLAAACRCPTVALFGPSDWRVWAPRGPTVKLLVDDRGRMEGISENDVLREVRSLLGG